jgi:hypothetical protein
MNCLALCTAWYTLYHMVQPGKWNSVSRPMKRCLPREVNRGRHPGSVASLARPMVSEAPGAHAAKVRAGLCRIYAAGRQRPRRPRNRGSAPRNSPRKTACKGAQSIESPARLNGISLSIPSPMD